MLFSFGSTIYQILQRLGGTRTASLSQSTLRLESSGQHVLTNAFPGLVLVQEQHCPCGQPRRELLASLSLTLE